MAADDAMTPRADDGDRPRPDGRPRGATPTRRPTGRRAATADAMPSRRAALLRTGVILGVLFLVFGMILPRFVDYEDVIAASPR